MIGEYYAISRFLDGVYKWCKCGVRYNNETIICVGAYYNLKFAPILSPVKQKFEKKLQL